MQPLQDLEEVETTCGLLAFIAEVIIIKAGEDSPALDM